MRICVCGTNGRFCLVKMQQIEMDAGVGHVVSASVLRGFSRMRDQEDAERNNEEENMGGGLHRNAAE